MIGGKDIIVLCYMKEMKKKIVIAACAALSCCSLASLTSCGSGEQVVIYTAAEEERIEFLSKELKKEFPKVNVVFQDYGTGALLNKLKNEGKKTDCDIFYDLEICNAENILSTNPDLFADLSDYDFSIYDESVTGYTKNHKKYAVNGKTDGALLVNKSLLQSKGLSVPTTYNDLLDSKYKGLLSMPSPQSSGTGYAFYAGITQNLGETAALEYFTGFAANCKEFTTSGSAPAKAVDRGEVAAGVGLLWQCVTKANANSNLQVVLLDNEASYNLFTMGMIEGKAKGTVKKVFDFLYTGLNKSQCEKYNPDKIYVNQGTPEIPNYPTVAKEISLGDNQYSFTYKNALNDKWKWQ